jgi:hypothetical protein
MKNILSSVKKLSTAKEVIGSIVPTGFAYNDFFKHLFGNEYESIALAVILFAVLFVFLIYDKVLNYEKAISEVLATGYFTNFIQKLSDILEKKNEITFLFKNNETLILKHDQVKVQLTVPPSYDSLNIISKEIKETTEIAYIDSSAFNHPYWLNAKRETDGTLTICEFPRTLFALPKYLINGAENYSENDSTKFHAAFKNKLEELFRKNADTVDRSKFLIKES